jgi:preprotein translocase subunit SecF
LGIDFTGGSILEVSYSGERPSSQEITQNLSDLSLGDITVQMTKSNGVIMRMTSINEDTHQEILQRLGSVNELSFESIGPSVGKELKQTTVTVIWVSILAMVIYIAIAFRRVSYPIKSWQYGLATLVILSHDVLLPIGALSILGNFYGIQITIPVVVALLTVVGYAINNVVVVFDRIKENLLRRSSSDFTETVNIAINQTLTRQINTSLTTLLPLVFIFFAGGETLKYFSLALILGLIAGTYSSIFLAGPLLVTWLRVKRRG